MRRKLEYRDLTWLMPSIDPYRIIVGLGVEPSTIRPSGSHKLVTYCPDHHLYVDRIPSHPRWFVDLRNGSTMCGTESRASNLLFTARRLLQKSFEETLEWMKGGADINPTHMDAVRAMYAARQREQDQASAEYNEYMEVIKAESEMSRLTDEIVQFFQHPPDKPLPTNICPQTLNRFGVYHKQAAGRYKDRAIIPVWRDGVVIGFSAVWMRTKEDWIAENPGKDEQDFRKVLFPRSMLRNKMLFNCDEIEPGADLIVTEGQREVMKLWQEGFPNAVALFGVYLSKEQYALLSNLRPRRISVMLDGDAAGYKLSESIANVIREWDNFEVRVIRTPDGRDPKNLNREELEALLA